jgi:NAD(P)-dependent dehydrogenase (short-subunit alcohol dehydrogenase family)
MFGGTLAEKRIAVFGAGTAGSGVGIGQATAICYARAGAHIIAVDIDAAAVAKTVDAICNEGGSVEAHVLDVRDAGAVDALIERITRDAPLDVAHNNVGVFRGGGVLDVTADDFKAIFDVNFCGAFNVAKAVLPGMLAQGSGVITNIGSYVSQRFLPGKLVYQVSKAALDSLTMGIALEFADKGIRCNGILPGVLDTPLAREGMRHMFESMDQLLAALDAASPTGKRGTPWDVANTAVFLASDAAQYINGQQIVVDGGAVWRIQ